MDEKQAGGDLTFERESRRGGVRVAPIAYSPKPPSDLHSHLLLLRLLLESVPSFKIFAYGSLSPFLNGIISEIRVSLRKEVRLWY